jgi:hypothetical protein
MIDICYHKQSLHLQAKAFGGINLDHQCTSYGGDFKTIYGTMCFKLEKGYWFLSNALRVIIITYA